MAVIRAPDFAFGDIPAGKPDRRRIEIARRIIEHRYETAPRELIRRKEKGEKLVTAEPAPDDNVIDLMEVLRKSLKAKGGASAPARRKAR